MHLEPYAQPHRHDVTHIVGTRLQSGLRGFDHVGQCGHDVTVGAARRDRLALVVRTLTFNFVKRPPPTRFGGVTVDEVLGNFVENAPNPTTGFRTMSEVAQPRLVL